MAVSDTDNLLEAVYMALLRHPHGKWRAENQALYAALRDSIASRKCADSQSVQDWFEHEARAQWPSL